ncbi:MAG: DUF364 domain-containing protein [Candidatus Caldatribacteriota bacterium]|nr:DUF364 domain-containing protein [Candidatus Caldatribacteriota bacterium]
MKIIEDIISTINKNTQNALVKEVRIGPFWTGVWSKYGGLASTTFVHEPTMPPPIKEAGNLTEKTVSEICNYANSNCLLQASIGMAAINSAIEVDLNKCQNINAAEMLYEKGKGKKVVVVGHFPFVDKLRKLAKQLWVVERKPQSGDIPASEAERVIPQADVIAITGTALINGTMPKLLSWCPGKSIVMVLGATTPLSPVWFDYGVDLVSGTRVIDPELVLRMVSEGVVFKQVHGRGVKLLTIQKDNC